MVGLGLVAAVGFRAAVVRIKTAVAAVACGTVDPDVRALPVAVVGVNPHIVLCFRRVVGNMHAVVLRTHLGQYFHIETAAVYIR